LLTTTGGTISGHLGELSTVRWSWKPLEDGGWWREGAVLQRFFVLLRPCDHLLHVSRTYPINAVFSTAQVTGLPRSAIAAFWSCCTHSGAWDRGPAATQV